jgi:hypothetical protein
MSATVEHDNLEKLLDDADRRHRKRRNRTATIYRTVERVFFLTLVALALLVLAKFASHVLPEYFH